MAETEGLKHSNSAFTRVCSGCGRKALQKGGGIRFVKGMRTFVCELCKDKIDANKAADYVIHKSKPKEGDQNDIEHRRNPVPDL